MIDTKQKSFYILNATREAAETLTSIFSSRSLKDVESITVLSKLFDNDIEPINELKTSIECLKTSFSAGYKESGEFNPLYFPSTPDQIDEILEHTGISGSLKFSGMNGNPFAIMSADVKTEDDELLIHSLTCYRPYDLPAYEEIIAGQKSFFMN